MSTTVKLQAKQSIVVQEEQRVEFDTCTIAMINNLPLQKKVNVILKEYQGQPITIWEGETYPAGDFTMEQVAARVAEMSAAQMFTPRAGRGRQQ